MSKAWICDKCGKILYEAANVRVLWMHNPFIASQSALEELEHIELCAECFKQFECEYMENTIENGGAL